MENTKKAFGYIRVSSDGQVEGSGLDRQRAAIQKYAAANGIQIVRWFSEEGVSGTLENRPALGEMMLALMSNGTRCVIVEKMDRIARDFWIQESVVRSILAKGFEFLSTAEPDLCSTDPNRKFIRQMLGCVAELDKNNVVMRLKAGRQRKRQQTGRCEGRKPFGAREGEQVVIDRIVALRSSGSNYEQIARQLNADGVKSRTGGQWFPAGVRRVVIAR
jgi:DNA invertase Pin-like site-specific DNA recombinase